MKPIYQFLLITFSIIFSFSTYAQVQSGLSGKYWNFEKGVPQNWKGDGLATSNSHYKVGQNSIQWSWKANDQIKIENPLGIDQAFSLEKPVRKSIYGELNNSDSKIMEKTGGLMCWIYNENPVDDYLTVEFGKDNITAYQFKYYMNYSGWRACWIRFSEMDQQNDVTSLNFMTFKAPSKKRNGVICFDRMCMSNSPIHGRSTPDQQLPFINPKVNFNHWGAQWYWETTFKHDIPLEPSITWEQKENIETIERRILEIVKGDVPHQDENWYYKDNFEDLRIVRDENGSVSGRPIVSSDEYDALLNDLKPLHVTPIFLGLARGYALADDDYCKEMFFDLFDHFVDQGYDYGSGTGTQHHVGYQMEGLSESFLLMKDALCKSGRLEKAQQVLYYWFGNAECRKDISVNELQGVVDMWNTKAKARLIAVLLMEDTPEKVREMKALSRFLSNSLQYSSGLVGGITPDGSMFHHSGLYPAYMTGAFMGVSPVVYALSHTNFEIEAQSRSNLAQSMLLMRNYSNKYDWPIGLSGRQVFAGKICQRVIDGMGYVAKSGDKNDPINKELASAYMRLAQPWERMYQEFEAQDIEAENNLDGFQVVNYACLGLHRRDDWLVSIKGYNKYVWSGEIYEHDNRWGRYMSYGTVQINNYGDPINGKSSGMVQDGWDWNRFPGTTTIHLPLDKLYCPTRSLMSRSDETFCGSSSLEGMNGIFGMKLHEKETLKNFTPDHRARKSVFCFDNRIICLGTNIENSNSEYPTETTLFQLESEQDASLSVNNKEITGLFSLNFDMQEPLIIDDNKGNRYFIPGGQKISIARQEQDSRHNKSERITHGIFSSAYINHGKAPKNGAYEYCVVVNGQDSNRQPEYKVLQKDKKAHIVFDVESKTTGLVLFEPGKVKHETIKHVDHEALVMLKKDNPSQAVLSLCSPSVNLESAKAYDSNGSIPVTIQLTLNGKWELHKNYANCRIANQEKNQTTFEFTCVDGKTVEVGLLGK